MIVSDTSIRLHSRWARAGVLLCAALVIPLGMGYAQDYDAVEKRLIEAVDQGEHSLEQAGAMMGTLRKAISKYSFNEEEFEHKDDDYLEDVWVSLEEKIESGEMSAVEAEATFDAISKKWGKDDKDWDDKDEWGEEDKDWGDKDGWDEKDKDWDDKDGWGEEDKDWDEKDEWDKAEKYEGENWDEEETRIAKYRAMEEEIYAAVKAGDLSEEAVDEKLAWLKEKMWPGDDDEDYAKELSREDYANAEIKLRKAAADGKISGEQARAKLAELRKVMAGQGEPDGEEDSEDEVEYLKE